MPPKLPLNNQRGTLHYLPKFTIKPVISSSLDKVGATKAYKDMMSSFTSLPFASAQSLDLDNYVTDKALGGLFLKVGEEEPNRPAL